MIPEYTVAIGVDAKTIQQLAVTLPTWLKVRPELARHPWFCFYDESQINRRDLAHWFGHFRLSPTLSSWPQDSTRYENQREKMLSGFVFATQQIRTQYYLKIDTDCIALEAKPWPLPEWFDGRPAYIASPWGYTKGGDYIKRCDDWADTLPGLADRPRLNIVAEPGSNRVPHARMCSWLAFYHTGFSRLCAQLCIQHSHRNKLPVPSEDTFKWFVAERLGYPYVRTKMKRYGWTNSSRITKLEQIAAGVMG